MSEIPAEMYLLAGVTAAGKSKISMMLAEGMGAEILSCDSVAVYKGMDIGSAKPNIQERQKLPHHGIDLVEVNEVYSVADYQVYIQKTVEEIKVKKNQSLWLEVVGFICSPFYPLWSMTSKYPRKRGQRWKNFTHRRGWKVF